MILQNPQTQNDSRSKPQMSKQHQSSSSSRPNSAFFPIPIFPPILASYDVPAPVIFPPGSKPCSLNPSPYHDQVLKTPSSMDIDPCVVASRRETVINKVDLTASEHAGVSFGEPATMVFTDPHTVNIIHSKCTQKITINQESKQKKQDSENITQIVSTVIAQETPSSAGNLTLHHESEKKKIDLLQKEAAGKSLIACDYPKSLFVCDIPEPGRKYQKIATVEEVDESFFKNPTTQTDSSSGTQNRPTKLSVHQPNRCDICKVSCNSDTAFNQHLEGKQHQKNLKISVKTATPSFINSRENLPLTVSDSPLAEKPTLTRGEVVNPNNEGNSLSCELCGVDCTSREMFTSHVQGKRHQKNLKRSEQQSVSSLGPVPNTPLPKPTIEEGENVFLEGSKRKADESCSSEDTKRQKTNAVLVTCKVCNVSCNDLMAFNTHLASFEHLAMLHKQSNGGSNGLQV